MSSVKYSKEQLQAINTKGTNLLVSASAGSGKTTVLIERIIRKIKEEKVNIDELLVVTFTEAAANELKLRLRKKITDEPDNLHLRKQLPKLGNAYISTFHAFCNQVLKKFFYLIDFEAIYTIADDVEVDMIAIDVLEELFIDCFEENDEMFILAINRFQDKTHDDKLKQIILDLYNKIRTYPFAQKMIEEILNNYQVTSDLSSWKFYPLFMNLINKKINEAKTYFTLAFQKAKISTHPYCSLYEEDVSICDELLTMKKYDDFYHYLKNLTFGRFNSRCENTDEINKEIIRSYRDKGKEIIINLKTLFQFQEKSQIKFLKENYKVLEALFYLVELFSRRFKEAKKERNLIDFNDLEELTLKIFTHNDGNNEAVKFYKDLFKEILIDEFQDTNSMQEAIINMITTGNNLFMVGDVKQSIYRFRSAEPEIFQKFYKKYHRQDNGILVNLNANYRSRKEIIDYINFLFCQLMDEKYFEIEYDEMAKLVFGQANYPNKLDEKFIHFHIIDKAKLKEEHTNFAKSEIEAHYVAQCIRNIVDSRTLIYDFKLGKERVVNYKDIVVMSRTKSDQAIYHDIFKLYNIPFLVVDLTGYFDSIEVMTVTSILRIIDNPLQDIPLVAVLRSPIFNINEKELIEIKVNSDKNYFYDKVEDYINKGKNSHLRDKLMYFYQMLDYWRNKVKYISITELLHSIYHETNYYDFVLGQVGGKQRQANLDLLFERAKQYEHLITNSLFKFIKLIDFFIENEKDLPQARTLSDNEDLVRFMTIHKSKGLEFPICFVTNLNKRYNIDDEKGEILFDKELGIGFSYLNTIYRVKYQTLYQNLIKDKLRKQLLAEELRLLYVALTRAKEHIYLIGTIDDYEKTRGKIDYLAQHEELLLPIEYRYVTDYLSLLLCASIRHPDICEMDINEKFIDKIKVIPQCDFRVIDSLDLVTNKEVKDQDIELDFSKYAKEISQRLNYSYPYLEKTQYFAKQTIADIKRAQSLSEYQYHHEQIMLKTPHFISSVNALKKGTSIHQFIQHIDYLKTYTLDDIGKLKKELLEKDIMGEDQLAFIDEEKIINLLKQEIIINIKKAQKIYQEMPFTSLISSKKVYPEMQDEVDILVQGVVDLLIEYDDYCILIDFKTDRLNSLNEIDKIKSQYQIQIDIYKDTMKKIYQGKEIKAYLYLFACDRFVEM